MGHRIFIFSILPETINFFPKRIKSSYCFWHLVLSSYLIFVNLIGIIQYQFSHSFRSDSATPWTAARQASLYITNFWGLLKLMSIEPVMPSNHVILCRTLLLLPSIFPSIRAFSKSQFFTSGGQSIGVSASASVLPMNTQDWFPLGYNTVYHCAFNFSLVPIRINMFFFCLFVLGPLIFSFLRNSCFYLLPIFFCLDICFFLTDSKEIFFILGIISLLTTHVTDIFPRWACLSLSYLWMNKIS